MRTVRFFGRHPGEKRGKGERSLEVRPILDSAVRESGTPSFAQRGNELIINKGL